MKRGHMARLTLLFSCFFVCALWGQPLQAEETEELMRPSLIYGRDDRVEVADTSESPYREVVALRMEFEGETKVMTGVLIAPNQVLTVAHAVIDYRTGEVAKGAVAFAGRNGLRVTAEQSRATRFHFLKNYIKTGYVGYTADKASEDLAVITLAQAIGSSYLSVTPDLEVNQELRLLGYPQDSHQKMMRSSGRVVSLANTGKTFGHKIDMLPGNSGSPILNEANEVVGINVSQPTVYADGQVTNYVPDNYVGTNTARRIDEDALNLIASAMTDAPPLDTVERVDLGSRASGHDQAQDFGKLEITPNPAGGFNFAMSNDYNPEGLSAFLIHIWSDKNGRDDVLQYGFNYYSSHDSFLSWIKVEDNHKDTGLYHAQVLYKKANGSLVTVTTATFEVAGEPDLPATGELTFVDQTYETGKVQAIVSNLTSPTPIQSVQLAVTSVKDGQSVTYPAQQQADGTYLAEIDIYRHGGKDGQYEVELYYGDEQGELSDLVVRESFELKAASSGQVAIQGLDVDKGSFDVLVTELRHFGGIQAVEVAVVSEQTGNASRQWYTAKRQADGTYRLSTDLTAFKKAAGTYRVEVYYRQTDGQRSGQIAQTSLTYAPKVAPSPTPQPQVQPLKVEVKNQNNYFGRFDLVVTGVKDAKKYSSILVEVWSEEKGRDDVQTYRAVRQWDGSFRATVYLRYHQYHYGTYQVKAKTSGVASATQTLGEASLLLKK